jgi:hypothetical protein
MTLRFHCALLCALFIGSGYQLLDAAKQPPHEPASVLAKKQAKILSSSHPDKQHANTYVGVLPYYYHEGKAYFLLRKNARGEWGAFSTEWPGDDSSYKDAALNAFAKQTLYVFGKFTDRISPYEQSIPANKLEYYKKRSIDYASARVTKDVHNAKKSSYIFLVCVDYIPEDTFNNAADLPDQRKHNYAYVPVDEFMHQMHIKQDRWQAKYLNKQINRHFYSTCNQAYHDIMSTIYPAHHIASHPLQPEPVIPETFESKTKDIEHPVKPKPNTYSNEVE